MDPATGAAAGSQPTLAEIGGWPAVLHRLSSGADLTAAEASAALGEVLQGNATPAQIAAFVFGLRCKGETVDEMTGLVAAMLDASERVPVDDNLAPRLVDTCGTGGDRSGTINVSTIAALVVAGAGIPVCKHGGRAASSRAGSADVLEALGVVIDLGPAAVAGSGSASRPGTTRPCATPARSGASSGCPPHSTSSVPWPIRPG
jgi:anthranilate phosphoribosyltransferase